MICNVVLISSVQKSDSVVCICEYEKGDSWIKSEMKKANHVNIEVPTIEEKERANLKVVSWEHAGLFENNREADAVTMLYWQGVESLGDKLKEVLGVQVQRICIIKSVGFYCA